MMASGTIQAKYDNKRNSSDGIDFDNEMRPFVYATAGSSTGTLPVNNNGYLFTYVRDASATKVQFYVTAGSNTSKTLYMRRMWQGAWEAWTSITFS